MNSVDILQYGHGEVKESVANLADDDWLTAGVCGHWSVKEILAHLASLEQLLVEVLRSLLEENGSPTPTLDGLLADEGQFNDDEVDRRHDLTIDGVWTEYEAAHETAVSLLSQIPPKKRRLNGTLPWYGEAYDLEDFLVYTYYGHKREHVAQIDAFRSAMLRPSEQAIA